MASGVINAISLSCPIRQIRRLRKPCSVHYPKIYFKHCKLGNCDEEVPPRTPYYSQSKILASGSLSDQVRVDDGCLHPTTLAH